MAQWIPELDAEDGPHYLALARAIARDIGAGRLRVGQRLPSQRDLARALGLHFTTAARGYFVAQEQGLIECVVGRGSFVCAPRAAPTAVTVRQRPAYPVDLTMNLPPQPTDPVLIGRMQMGLAQVSADIVALMQYQGFGGSKSDRTAALAWLQRRDLQPTFERVLVTPGAHAAIQAILLVLASMGDVILCEAVTYPGIRSIAAQLGLQLKGVPMDDHGPLPEPLREMCKTWAPKAIYLNPTLQNPTTLTVPLERRLKIAAVAEEFGVPIIEDDAYGFIPMPGQSPPTFASILPNLTWYIAGMSKCVGAGLRLAYVVAPDLRSTWLFSAAMRASSVMASPLTTALATQWIDDGTAALLLRHIRSETHERFNLARKILPEGSFQGDPMSFSLWLTLPRLWTRTAFVEHMRSTQIGIVPSDAFVVDGPTPETVRLCLGGPSSRAKIQGALEFAAHALEESPALASSFL